MSAEFLRTAAALMRVRAQMATSGPWHLHTAAAAADSAIFSEGAGWVTNVENCPRTGEHAPAPGGTICTDQAIPNGEHIASWHPLVALAVADLLDEAVLSATQMEALGASYVDIAAMHYDAIRVARAYLAT